jgi:hypothetical protein
MITTNLQFFLQTIINNRIEIPFPKQKGLSFNKEK